MNVLDLIGWSRTVVARCTLAVIVGAGVPAVMHAEVRVRVVETDPASPATLGRDETFYVRIEYDTDEPIRIWARPFFQGTPVAAKSNPSITYTGRGEALGWFALDDAVDVDEIRIIVGGGTPYRESQATTYPVSLSGSGHAAAPRRPAEWVAPLERAAADAARREQER
ncbi:MAG TPA: hypothetical protein VFX12_10110, partial [Vicinamibacterales bacterium]|nr:hypothetical protein [Vicinamibacterales bacterium]